MSLAGVGNAAAGAALVEVIKSAFTNYEDKTATKADIKYLANKLKIFHRVLNMLPKPDGKLPYFDTETKKVIYF